MARPEVLELPETRDLKVNGVRSDPPGPLDPLDQPDPLDPLDKEESQDSVEILDLLDHQVIFKMNFRLSLKES